MAQYKFARIVEWEHGFAPKGSKGKGFGYKCHAIDESGEVIAHGSITSDVISALAKDNWTVVIDPTKGGVNPDIEYPSDVIEKAQGLLDTHPSDAEGGKGAVRRVMALKVGD